MTERARFNSRRARHAIREGDLDNHSDIALAIGLPTHLEDPPAKCLEPRRWKNRKRRAELYAEHLRSLRLETFMVRRQLDNPRNDGRRGLLALRLDAIDARAAHINACLAAARAV
jgi:hypothetical protein